MKFVEDNFEQMFTASYRKNNYREFPVEYELATFEATDFRYEEFAIDVQVTFDDPMKFGLLNEKDDKLFVNITENFNVTEIFVENPLFGEATETVLLEYASGRIEIIFDFNYDAMKNMTVASWYTFYGVLALMVGQVILLALRNVSLFSFWKFIDYAQLVAYLPLFSSRYIPYIYESYKTFMMTHLVFTRTTLKPETGETYMSPSYQFYGFNDDHLMWVMIAYGIVFVLILIVHAALAIYSKAQEEDMAPWAQTAYKQFYWTVYIRFFFVGYLDFVFLSLVRIVDPSYTRLGTFGLILAIILLTISIVLPVVLIYALYNNYYNLGDKQAPYCYRALVDQIDKKSHMRLFAPILYFLRRFLFAVNLVMSLEEKAVFLQYVCLLCLCFLNLFYLLCYDPHSTNKQNMYVVVMEFLFLLLCSCQFMFTDANPDTGVKSWTAILSGVLLWLIVVLNILFVVYHAVQGHDKLKAEKKTEQARKMEDLTKAVMARKLVEKRQLLRAGRDAKGALAYEVHSGKADDSDLFGAMAYEVA